MSIFLATKQSSSCNGQEWSRHVPPKMSKTERLRYTRVQGSGCMRPFYLQAPVCQSHMSTRRRHLLEAGNQAFAALPHIRINRNACPKTCGFLAQPTFKHYPRNESILFRLLPARSDHYPPIYAPRWAKVPPGPHSWCSPVRRPWKALPPLCPGKATKPTPSHLSAVRAG